MSLSTTPTDETTAGQRIGENPYDNRYPVYTSHDLGRRDSQVIWFFQNVNGKTLIV